MSKLNSPKFSLNTQDGKKIATGLGIAVAGAVLTYGAETIPNIDFGNYTPVVVALFSVFANAVRKWLANR